MLLLFLRMDFNWIILLLEWLQSSICFSLIVFLFIVLTFVRINCFEPLWLFF
jgi:hypothetical protein